MPAVVLPMLLLAAAGCAAGDGAPEDDNVAMDPLPAEGVAAGPPAPPLPPAPTDTFHLRQAPWLNFTALPNETVLAVKGPYAAQTFVWNRTLGAHGNITGAQLRVWLLLPHSAVQAGAGNDPGCTLQFTLVTTYNGTQQVHDGGCASLGLGTIPPGEYLLDVTAPPPAAPLQVGPGANLVVQLTVGLVQPNGGAAYILGGGRYESQVVLQGMAEPVVDETAPSGSEDAS